MSAPPITVPPRYAILFRRADGTTVEFATYGRVTTAIRAAARLRASGMPCDVRRLRPANAETNSA